MSKKRYSQKTTFLRERDSLIMKCHPLQLMMKVKSKKLRYHLLNLKMTKMIYQMGLKMTGEMMMKTIRKT